ncbi:hypothetical protein BD309DRAFT_945783 [Dichomitus squalens]|uniref:Uncharacterized protein n=1 Tax=Dichomitus squalens TaxID=114155 RepID=A0A4Q9QCN8_9APHY|nr:hypothetical protein BD309DRAFT_945783 [Dichomitus squalens]TBU65405.1 hypothetical protein BD310DRAFT_911291 [Dichomitus squalens]
MSRQLRTRASRPNYAVLSGYLEPDEDGAGPSQTREYLEEDDSGSEFEPDAVPEQQGADDAEDMALDDAEPEDEPEASTAAANPRRRQTASTRESSLAGLESASVGPRRKSAPPKPPAKRSVVLAPGLSHFSNRQQHALPSQNHRHRSFGIHQKDGKTERLIEPPRLFEPASITLTNAWGVNSFVVERLNKAWGYNIGPGPLWDMAEDRGWFKEAYGSPNTTEKERRPRVHEGLRLGAYRLLSPSEAIPYLPSDVQNTHEGAYKPPPPVACSFGPFGKQTRLEVNRLDSIRTARFFPGSKAHVFNAGAPVWAIDWCPIHPDDRSYYQHGQYLAVAPFPSRSYSPMIGSRVQRPSSACIQLWSLSSSPADENAMDVDGGVSDAGEMRCELVLCLDSGPAYDLKWCPLPANDSTVEANDATPRKLGILGGTFGDGSLTFYVVPDPKTIDAPADHPANTPLYVKPTKPLLRIELEETCCWSLDWANSEVVAIGCTNGNIAIYNIATALYQQSSMPFFPTHYFTVHQSAIRSIAWIRVPVCDADGEETSDDPTVLVSGGYDGVETITDIRELRGNVMNRTRDVVTTICYSAYAGSAITIDHENIIKAYSVAPIMLGRGHTLLEPNGPIWSLAASDYHPQIAIGVTDGSCLTTNALRSTRRGGLIPFMEHKIYQLDYSRAVGEYRMLEHFLPKETQNRPAATRQNKTIPVGTGAWPPDVGIHRVVWNDRNGLAGTPLLASATGSGLCRVDWLPGKWGRDPLPYNGVEGMRAETGGEFDEDDESD